MDPIHVQLWFSQSQETSPSRDGISTMSISTTNFRLSQRLSTDLEHAILVARKTSATTFRAVATSSPQLFIQMQPARTCFPRRLAPGTSIHGWTRVHFSRPNPWNDTVHVQLWRPPRDSYFDVGIADTGYWSIMPTDHHVTDSAVMLEMPLSSGGGSS